MESRKLRFLWIEYSEEIVANHHKWFEAIARGAGLTIEIIQARDKEEARALLKRESFDVILLEMTIPNDKEAVRKLGELDRERARVLDELVKITGPDDDYFDPKVMDLRSRIDVLDKEAEAYECIDGGCEILEELARDYGINGKLEIPVIICSGLIPPIRADFHLWGFLCFDAEAYFDRCKKAVNPQLFRLLRKPLNEVEVVQTLFGFLSIPFPGPKEILRIRREFGEELP